MLKANELLPFKTMRLIARCVGEIYKEIPIRILRLLAVMLNPNVPDAVAADARRRFEAEIKDIKITDPDTPERAAAEADMLKWMDRARYFYRLFLELEMQHQWKPTPREIDVMSVVLDFPEATEKELAVKLSIDETTVRDHIGNICDKAGVPPGPNRKAALISKFYQLVPSFTVPK